MNFWAELKRRNVYRVALFYIVAAWVFVEVAETVLPVFDVPDEVLRGLVIVLMLGFLPAVISAWVYELTPEGLKRETDPSLSDATRAQGARRLDIAVIVLLLAAMGLLALDRLLVPTAGQAPAGAEVAVEPGRELPGHMPDRSENSIAVLPFVNMSADPAQEYFSDGLSEEILNLLAQFTDLTVIGRSSSFAFKGRNEDLREIGDQLGVAYLLEGSVRKSGDELRITAQLIEADGGSHLWSQSYDRRLENVFEVQTEIATAIAEALRLSLILPEGPAAVTQEPTSIPAYERFLQARRLIQGRDREGLDAARALLDEAMALDPDYAPPYAAAAQAVLLLSDAPNAYGDIPFDRALATAQDLVERSLALDARLAEAHAIQGLVYLAQGDRARSEAALAQALEFNPSLSDALNWRAANLSAAGRLSEVLFARRHLAEVDPLNLSNLSNVSLTYQLLGQSDNAIAVAKRIQRAFPHAINGLTREADSLTSIGRLADARAVAERGVALGSEDARAQRTMGWVSFSLGDFDQVIALPLAEERGPALIGLGQAEEAIATARERWAASPGNAAMAYRVLHTLSLAERHGEVLALYRDHWGDPEGLQASFGYSGWTREMAPVAAAQRAMGRQEELTETLDHWHRRLSFLKEQGYRVGWFRGLEAKYFALAGYRDQALAGLAESIDLGYRDPLLQIDPAFATLKDDAAFQRQLQRMTDLINAEREKLGMGPLS